MDYDYDPNLGIVEWTSLYALAASGYQTAATFVSMYEWPLRIAFILAGLGLLLWQADKTVKWRKKVYRIARGKQMTRKDRLKQQKAIQADAIFNALDRLVDEGKSLPHEIAKTLRAVHNFLDMPDLIPLKPVDVRGMTAEEIELLEGIFRSKVALRKLLLSHKKISIPGPKPGEDVYKPTKVVDFARAKLGEGTRRQRVRV